MAERTGVIKRIATTFKRICKEELERVLVSEAIEGIRQIIPALKKSFEELTAADSSRVRNEIQKVEIALQDVETLYERHFLPTVKHLASFVADSAGDRIVRIEKSLKEGNLITLTNFLNRLNSLFQKCQEAATTFLSEYKKLQEKVEKTQEEYLNKEEQLDSSIKRDVQGTVMAAAGVSIAAIVMSSTLPVTIFTGAATAGTTAVTLISGVNLLIRQKELKLIKSANECLIALKKEMHKVQTELKARFEELKADTENVNVLIKAGDETPSEAITDNEDEIIEVVQALKDFQSSMQQLQSKAKQKNE